MKCTVSFVSVVAVILVIGTLAIIILITIPESCPGTSFKCDEDDQCFAIKFKCDGKQHCSNGSDELPHRCADLINLSHSIRQTFSHLNATRISTTPRPKIDENLCNVQHPPDCSCRGGYKVYCQDLAWTAIDWTLFDNATVRLLLKNVLVEDWQECGAVDFSNLKVLQIEDNPKMRTFPAEFLKDKTNVNFLFLENNIFESLNSKGFEKMSKLENLLLSKNLIRELHPNAFYGLDSLIFLDLSSNQIQFDWTYQFQGMPRLDRLNLQNNQIENIGSPAFRSLTKLTQLNLNHNKIQVIHARAFRYNEKLRELHISGNNIHSLDSSTFSGLPNLIKLQLAENPIHRLSPSLFSSTTNLQSLDLTGLDLENIDLQIFSLLTNLSFVHFKKFEYCQYVPRVPNCRPTTDGISSIQNLLNGKELRAVVWVITLFTVIGNVLVISTRWKSNKDRKIQDVFMKNLAAADLLMGVYLGIIGIKDYQYRGIFNTQAYSWYNSWECIFIGVLAMVSCEVSLLILTVMSLERYLVISGPPSYRKLTKNWAMASMALLWAFIIALAVTPAFMWKSSYFGSSGLCFTLHLHDAFAVGWEYNAFVFIGINSMCLICIAIFYGRLFWVVRETSSSTPLVVKDVEMAIRFFLMVLTDFFCWAPIILLKFSALKGYRVPDSVLAWTTIFIMPLNSAINPMLYTFSTRKIRIKLFAKLFATHTSDTRNLRQNIESVEGRLMTPDATDDSKINSSQDWRQKLSTVSSDHSEAFSLVGSARSKRENSGTSNASDPTSGSAVNPC